MLLGACSSQPGRSADAGPQPDATATATATATAEACANPQGDHTRGNCLLQGMASELTLHGDLWERLKAGHQLTELSAHPRVQEQLEWYLAHPQYLQTIAERSQRYLHYIANEIEARKLPAELALLPAIESAYDPFAYSAGRAAGLWQFIPLTARHVGLRHSYWYDARRDVVSSTEAALDYLESLNKRFDGDWLLTLAAYNSGAGTVSRARRENERRGRKTDYWSLSLPDETRSYIPKLLALNLLVREAGKHNIVLEGIPNKPYFEIVKTDGQLDLAQAAELAGVSIDEIYRLNPGYNRWATDPDGPHRLLVPVDAAPVFRQHLAGIPAEQRLRWSTYTVQNGDNLITIARQFQTDVATIRASNKLNSNLIRAGQVLLLPSASKSSQHYSLSAEQRLARAQSRGGDNGLHRVVHVVSSGESLWSIARQHDVSVGSLTKWNNMAARDPIRPGQELAVWKPLERVGANVTGASREIIRKVGYTVRRGDSLAAIAGRFNVRVHDIVHWNEINPTKYLQPGQYLTLYVDVTKVTQLTQQ